MITIALSLVFCVGLVLLYRGLKSAPVGYQDESGFHAGKEPASEMDKAA